MCRFARTSVACCAGRGTVRAGAAEVGGGSKGVTADGKISLEEVECMGACSWAPALQVNYEFHHNVTPEKLDQLLESLKRTG